MATKVKLDKDGFIFPLAIGALALLFFAWFFLNARNANKAATSINSVQGLDQASKDLDSQNPDTFTTDLNLNASEASKF